MFIQSSTDVHELIKNVVKYPVSLLQKKAIKKWCVFADEMK